LPLSKLAFNSMMPGTTMDSVFSSMNFILKDCSN
jgi:hypothetical protein